MILYHGSDRVVPHPDLSFSRERLDFGKGFYTTPIYDQAVRWAQRFKNRGGHGVLSVYEFDENKVNVLSVKTFTDYSEDWLDFVLTCRRGMDSGHYDIVSGGIANDKVFNTVELFFDGLIDKNEAIKRLRYEPVNRQICFRTDAALLCLKFVRSEEIC